MQLKKIIILAVTGLLFSVSAQATDLLDVYRDAVKHDPIFAQAVSQAKSDKTRLQQALSGLLTRVDFTGDITRQKDRTSATVSTLFPPIAIYNTHNLRLSLSQPVFNLQAWMSVKLAKNTVKQATATLNAARQNLMVRVAQAYFDVLDARDRLRFTTARKRANRRQLDQAQQRFKVGLEAITSVYEARAAYDTARAEEIGAKIAEDNANEALRNLTGRTYPDINGLVQTLPLIPPVPKRSDAWVQAALRQNYSLIATNYARRAARENIRVQGLANLPVVSANLAYTDFGSNAPLFAGRFTTTTAASLQANFPIWQGGNTIAKTHQAKYDYQVATARFEEIHRNVEVGTVQTYNIVMAGISKIRADRQAVISAKNSVESTEAQFKVGTRTMVDVLLAQQQLFQAQSTLASDQYEFINATFRLKELAGTISPHDLAAVNYLLHDKDHFAAVNIPNKKPSKKV